ncbi:amidase-domain-containing protein [Acephala macrosclerotiorum]|nr:amidase-domain-containing protein [Acephala macrosclerotiorum]
MSRPVARSAEESIQRVLRHGMSSNVFIPNNSTPTKAGFLALSPLQREIAIKDNIATTPFLTTCASRTLRLYQSPFEAGVVQELRQRGATVAGKTNLDEFGMGSHSTNSFFGPITNVPPFQRISVGGSSGGSAIAVATEQCGLALGTDTGGSVRLPAAYTGITGFKPSYGYISRWGVIPYANSLDTVGILALSTHLIELGLQCSSHPDPRDPTSLTEDSRRRIRVSLRRSKKRERERRLALGELGDPFHEKANSLVNLRVGVPMEYNIEELEPGVQRVWRSALKLLQDKGATLVPISLPNTKHALSAYYVLAPAEAASNLSKYDGVRYGSRANGEDGAGGLLYSTTRGQGFGEEVKRRILLGSYTLSSEARDNYFLKAQKVRRLVQRDFNRVFAAENPLRPNEQFDLSDLEESIPMQDKLGPPQVDVIVCPTAPTTAPDLEDVSNQTPVDTYMNDVFTVPASLAGLPAISVPFTVPRRFRKTNHPNYAGIQIIGQFGDDLRVIDVAKRLEALRDFSRTLSLVSNKFAADRETLDLVGRLRQADKDGDSVEALRALYLTERKERTRARPHIRKIPGDGDSRPWPREKRLSWSKNGNELIAMPSNRITHGHKSFKPITDAEIDQEFQGALDIWERIKGSGDEKA